MPEQAEIKAKLLDLMIDGKLMSEACVELGIDRKTIWRWRQADEDFDKAYEDAHKAMAVAIAEDGLWQLKKILGTSPSKGDVAAASAYAQRTSWMASKLLPKVYGDNTGPSQVNNFNGPVQAIVCDEAGRKQLIETRNEALRLANKQETTTNTEHEKLQPNHTRPTEDCLEAEEA